MSPSVSIIVPAYNAGRFLEATLGSIRAQTLSDFECIVVDDGSTDATAEIALGVAKIDSRFRLLQQANQGHGAAKNAGYGKSDGGSRYVVFMDADDLWMPHALATLVAAIERDPEAVGAHGIADQIDDQGRPLNPGKWAAYERERIGLENLRAVAWAADRPTTFSVLAYEDRVFPSGVILYRRGALAGAGLFDVTLPQHEDTNLHLRLAARGHFAFVDDILVLYRQHAANWSKRNKEAARAYWEMRQRLGASPLLTDEHRRILARTGVLFQRRKTAMWFNAGNHDLAKGHIKKAVSCYLHWGVNAVRIARVQLTGSC